MKFSDTLSNSKGSSLLSSKPKCATEALQSRTSPSSAFSTGSGPLLWPVWTQTVCHPLILFHGAPLLLCLGAVTGGLSLRQPRWLLMSPSRGPVSPLCFQSSEDSDDLSAPEDHLLLYGLLGTAFRIYSCCVSVPALRSWYQSDISLPATHKKRLTL